MSVQAPAEDILEYAENEGFKKLYAMALWGFDWLDKKHYDEYGSGVDGIANVLQEHGINIKYKGRNVIIDDNGRLYVYAPIPLQEKIYKHYMKIYSELQPDEREVLAKLVAISLDRLVNMLKSYFNKDNIEMVEKVLDRYFNVVRQAIEYYKRLLPYNKIQARYVLNEIVNLFMENNIEYAIKMLDKAAKDTIIHYTTLKSSGKSKFAEAERDLAAFLVRMELLLGAPIFADDNFYHKIESVKPILGALLQLAHMAAVLSVIAGKPIYTKNELMEFLEELKNNYGFEEDSILYSVVKRLGEAFLSTEESLYENDAVTWSDYKSTHITIVSSGERPKIYVKTGGAGGHYAYIDVKSTQDLVVEYSDHDLARMNALVTFLRNIGVPYKLKNDNEVVFEWKRSPEELGMLLAGLTSLDLAGAYDALRNAMSVKDFIEKRIHYNP